MQIGIGELFRGDYTTNGTTDPVPLVVPNLESLSMFSVVTTPNTLSASAPSVRTERTVSRVDPLCWAGLGLCLLGCLALLVDLPISRWMHTRQGLKGLHQPLQVVEGLGDITGVAILLVSLFLIHVERRRELWRLFCAVLAGGLLADVVKFCVARLRPRSYPGEGLLQVSSVFDTFHGWFPFFQSEIQGMGSKFQSFPSAHTATGFALAVALSRLYPKGWWWFGLLAAGVALQRVETGAHYVSDTCFGAAVGLLAALSFQQGTPWARWFDQYEHNTNQEGNAVAGD